VVKIYTRKGDDGSTSLWYGGRVRKDHDRTEAYGAVDEAVSALGLARSLCPPDGADLAADILQIQEDLFVAGAELATAPEAADRLEDGVSRVTAEMVSWAEERIDHWMARVDLPPQFVIPGGTTVSAALDLARSTIRRAERRIASLNGTGEISGDNLLHFVNRASDLAYAMARAADDDAPALFEGRRKS